MNEQEQKKLHDSMQKIFDRSQKASSPKNYFPLAYEFAVELFNNAILEGALEDIREIGRRESESIISAKTQTLSEIEATIQLLSSYHKTIPALSQIAAQIEATRNKSPKNSNELVFDLNSILQMASRYILCDRSVDHSNILEQLVKRDGMGRITDYIFAPTFAKWWQKLEICERNNKTSVFNSCVYLNNLRLYNELETRSNRIQWYLDNHQSIGYRHIEYAENFDQILTEQDPNRAAALGFDVEECKIHIDRIWSYLKSKLSESEIKTVLCADSYDRATGVLLIDGQEIKFQRYALRGQILENLFPGGIALKDSIGFDEIYEGIIAEQNCAVWKSHDYKKWDDLTQIESEKIKKDIYDAYSGINDRIAKETESKIKDFIKVDNLTLSINIY